MRGLTRGLTGFVGYFCVILHVFETLISLDVGLFEDRVPPINRHMRVPKR